MTFEIDDDSGGLGVVKTVDLLRGGGSQRRVLTRSDVNQYIVLVSKYWMFDRIKHHTEHIRRGINDVVRAFYSGNPVLLSAFVEPAFFRPGPARVFQDVQQRRAADTAFRIRGCD